MSNDVLITPASRKIEFKDSSANVDAKIETDASGNLVITNAGGDISIGDTTSDIFVGDGTNNIDIVFEQAGEIRGTTGVTVTLGAADSNIRMATDLNLNSNDITNVNDLTITGNLNITGDINSYNVTDLDVTDKTITVGAGQTEANSGGSGLIVDGSGASLLWDEGDNYWAMNKSLAFDDTVTTTNQALGIKWTGFDKEGTTDFTDSASIVHTVNTGGHSGSVLLIQSQNDSADGIAFVTNASSYLKHNSSNILTAANAFGQLGITSTAAELNKLDGYTGSVTELNYLDTLHATGVTSTEFDYLDGVTSNIQTQLNAKQASGSYLTSSSGLNASNLTSGTVSTARLAHPTSGDWWKGGPPLVATDGVMEIGKYIDFHNTDTTTADFDTRLISSGTDQLTINGSGRIFTDGYHPNADTLTTARTIGGVSFNGSANINLPGVNTAGNQNTSGTAAGLSGTPNITVGTATATYVDAGTVEGNGMYINTPDTGSSPAITALLRIYGYEGRGAGIKIRDSANSATSPSNREWFIGSGYSQSGFNIGYAADGSQSSYSAQNKFSISTAGHAAFAGNITVTGEAAFNGTKLEGDSKEMLRFSDSWLRINPDNDFTSGIYAGTGILRTDGTFQVGSGGSAFSVTSAGNVNLSGLLDGRDVAADGTKLDTIATNADVTPSWVPSSNPNYLTGNQTITLSGDVSGSGTTSISVTVDNYILNDQYATVGSRYSGNGSDLSSPSKASIRLWDVSEGNDEPSGASDGIVYTAGWDSTSWAVQQFHDFHSNDFYLRSKQSGTWMSTWDRVFHDTYHPNADKWTTARTLSLTGAVTGSVSWDGSANASMATTATADPTLTLSGDASGSATFTNLGNATLSVTVADDSHNHIISNVDGLQSALDAKLPLTGGTLTGKLTTNTGIEIFYNDHASGAVWDTFVHIGKVDDASNHGNVGPVYQPDGSYGMLAQANSDGMFVGLEETTSGNYNPVIKWGDDHTSGEDLFFRHADDTLVARMSYNSFTVDGTISTTGGSMSGQLLIDSGQANPLELKRSSQVGIEFNDTSVGSRYLGVNSGNLFFGGNLNHANNARVFHDTYHPNADTWTTARTITLGGDLTGNVSINGSANVTLTAAVADDSHNHVISNVDGLQTALDAKLASSSYTAADVLTKIKTVDGSGSGLDADTLDGVESGSFLRSNEADTASGSINFTNDDYYFGSRLRHHGNGGAYMQFHAADQWRVVTGGTERLEVNNNAVKVSNGPLLIPDAEYIGAHTSTKGRIEFDASLDGGVKLLVGSTELAEFVTNSGPMRLIFQPSLGEHMFIRHENVNTNVCEIGFHFDNDGTQTEAQRFISDGTIHADGDVIAYSTQTSSDIRLKENVRPLEGSLNKILDLRGVQFDWKEEKRPNDQLGFIAQEVEEVLPEIVKETVTLSEEGKTHKTVNYEAVIPVLVEAIKEQQHKINELTKQVQKLKEK